MDLFLLIGQSNMAGRGPLDANPKSANQNIAVLNAENEWVVARDPLHFDKPTMVGVGPGLAFAERWLELNPKTQIGLIPCAVGGSGIDDWQPGQKHAQTGIYAYDAMLQRVSEAQKKGKIKAILWHQGESDSNPVRNKVYEEKLDEFFSRLRRDLDAPNTPIILGTLGDFIVKKNPNALPINQIITNFPQNHPNVYAVSSAGLSHKGDTTHFDTPSARELGKRYAEKLWEIQKK
ncbi:acetylxylan esterase [Persicitalea jodogahamensis]|uniref:Acetylxylan esterase n=2 Tax=Persicitalea jodogahamensis TaxID=402147 RepID=A0A8J3GB74_9BACT|nr:acetylxylan esterase [Persicitalea jodogahamensis]